MGLLCRIASPCLLALLVATPIGAGAPTESPRSIEGADLKQRLEKDLRARLPAEFAFVARVVELVRSGRLPVKVVDVTYLWARDKQPHPFPYFERALRLRAKALGIEL